jgi:hypothetical protein
MSENPRETERIQESIPQSSASVLQLRPQAIHRDDEYVSDGRVTSRPYDQGSWEAAASVRREAGVADAACYIGQGGQQSI